MTVFGAGAIGVVVGIVVAVLTRRVVWWVFSDVAPRHLVVAVPNTKPRHRFGFLAAGVLDLPMIYVTGDIWVKRDAVLDLLADSEEGRC